MRYFDMRVAGSFARATATRSANGFGAGTPKQTGICASATDPAIGASQHRAMPSPVSTSYATACHAQRGGFSCAVRIARRYGIIRGQGARTAAMAVKTRRLLDRRAHAFSVRRPCAAMFADWKRVERVASAIDTSFGLDCRDGLLRGSVSRFRNATRPGAVFPLSGAGSSGRCKGD